jgi:hypothetical protein
VGRLVAAFGVFNHPCIVTRPAAEYWRKSDTTVGP